MIKAGCFSPFLFTRPHSFKRLSNLATLTVFPFQGGQRTGEAAKVVAAGQDCALIPISQKKNQKSCSRGPRVTRWVTAAPRHSHVPLRPPTGCGHNPAAPTARHPVSSAHRPPRAVLRENRDCHSAGPQPISVDSAGKCEGSSVHREGRETQTDKTQPCLCVICRAHQRQNCVKAGFRDCR